MGIFSRLFGKSDYLAGSRVVDPTVIDAVMSAYKPHQVIADDAAYTQLTAKNLQWFVEKYHPEAMPGYAAEVYDCDDFARAAVCAVAKGALREGFKYPLLFGVIVIAKSATSSHALNVAITSDDQVLLYEPQRRTWIFDFGGKTRVLRVEF